MTVEQGDIVIRLLAELQVQLVDFSQIFRGGFFWFAMFCVGVALVLVAEMLFVFVDFFIRLLWGRK